MKPTTRLLTIGLALFLANFASRGMAQSTPQQVKGISSQGVEWQALTVGIQVAVATNSTTEYVAWTLTDHDIDLSSSVDGVTWTTPITVGGTYSRGTWKAQTLNAPAIAVDSSTGLLWVVWTDSTTSDLYYSTYNGVAWIYRQGVSGSGWAAQNFFAGASPTVGGGNGITVAWIESLNGGGIYYSNWTYPGWSAPKIVGNSNWTASPSPSGFSTPSLTQALSGPSAMYWVDYYSQDIFGAAYIFGAWVGDNAIGCNSWTAQTFDTNAPAAANFTLKGQANAMLFWINLSGNDYQMAYTYETFGGNGCGWANPATIEIVPAGGLTNLGVGPAVSVGSRLSILAWPELISSGTSTVWYMNPLTLPGLH